jgi:hypothetical protein
LERGRIRRSGQAAWTDASGALEAINEWSFATYDEALLDEHDGYDVTDDIAQALKTQFEKEVA